jgi:CRP-like cAMP-binding protein
MLDLESQYLLFRHATADRSYAAGDVVFEAGDAGDCMYLVKSGSVALELGDQRLETVGSGGLFGEMSLIDGSARSARAVATEPTLLVPIGLQRFKFLIQAAPDFSLNVMGVMAERLRASNARLLEGSDPGP